MKHCPQCRIHIPSRRSLRPDTNFDELVQKIYGDVSSLEKYEEEENAQLNKQNIKYYDAESVKRRILHQNEQRVSTTTSSDFAVVFISIEENENYLTPAIFTIRQYRPVLNRKRTLAQ